MDLFEYQARDLFEKHGMLSKEGNRLAYTTIDGEVLKMFRKGWESNEDGCLDKVMTEFSKKQTNKLSNVADVEQEAA